MALAADLGHVLARLRVLGSACLGRRQRQFDRNVERLEQVMPLSRSLLQEQSLQQSRQLVAVLAPAGIGIEFRIHLRRLERLHRGTEVVPEMLLDDAEDEYAAVGSA